MIQLIMRLASVVPIIIFFNVVVFFLWSSGDYENQVFMQNNFAVSWEALLQGHWWVLLTSVFSQNLFFHLFFNMFVLSSFGGAIESVLGPKNFVIFYLVTGAFSSFTHAAVSAFLLKEPGLPALGASGAIAGVLLLFCLLFPKEKLLLFGLIPLPAIWAAIAFVSLDIWGLITQSRGGGLPIGHGAHLGGAFCGLLAYLYLRKQKRSATQARSAP